MGRFKNLEMWFPLNVNLFIKTDSKLIYKFYSNFNKTASKLHETHRIRSIA
jgi:hypothetical protein